MQKRFNTISIMLILDYSTELPVLCHYIRVFSVNKELIN
jgi:hypothetical protein